jgi:hypothetical protein
MRDLLAVVDIQQYMDPPDNVSLTLFADRVWDQMWLAKSPE